MFRAAVEGYRLIAMALLESGWEADYEGRPAISPVVCVGRVLTWQAQPDDRYNLLLLGLKRARIVRELPPAHSFREAQVELLEDDYPAERENARPALQRRLIQAFEEMLPCIQDAGELFNQLSVDSIALGTLTDVISYAMDLDVSVKQSLLTESNVDRRARSLVAKLRAAAKDLRPCAEAAGFPPAFSAN